MHRDTTNLLLPLLGLFSSVAVLTATGTASAAHIYSTATGDWNVATTWSGGVVPTSADNVSVIVGTTVTVPSGLTVTRNADTETRVLDGGRLVVAGTFDSSGAVMIGRHPAGSLNTGAFLNSGRFEIYGGAFYNRGSFVSSGTIVLPAGGDTRTSFENDATGTLTNSGTVDIYAYFANAGTISNSGVFKTNAWVTGTGTWLVAPLVNSGKFTNEATGRFHVTGDLINDKEFINLGTVNTYDGSSAYQTGFRNKGTVENRATIALSFRFWNEIGTVTNHAGATISAVNGTLRNDALLENYGAIPTGTCATCLVANFGTINNYCGGTVGKTTGDPVTMMIPCADAGTDAGDAGEEDSATADTGEEDSATADTGEEDSAIADSGSVAEDSATVAPDAAATDSGAPTEPPPAGDTSDSSSCSVRESGASAGGASFTLGLLGVAAALAGRHRRLGS